MGGHKSTVNEFMDLCILFLLLFCSTIERKVKEIYGKIGFLKMKTF